MLTVAFPARAFDTNCYVVATGPGEECLVVDPGVGIEDTLRDVLEQHRLRPAAVLLTHGHLDHVYSVTPVCGSDTAAYIHADDRYRLTDLLAQTNPGLVAMFEQQFGARATWTDPTDVVEITDGTRLSLAGLDVDVLHAPGHTEGSVMFGLGGIPDGVSGQVDVDRTMVSGDVVFAGSIGRTDLPGGSHEAMQRSLRDVVLPLPDTTLVLPGHGPATTMAHERRTNPYLKDLPA
ncbi:glyoxylase-like metal-dependent hydrolase (beta-lactamase superfamily II) [Terracoccus luteus]|uniref:Glyoxylase-like metal-dependent hydrolase (Beta-lactamase superfamily II) n=1 Tax=Terracoccus luteus TaxID=53356 RepID=A0A495XWZ5_9MICO|nr:MBL fold metallo-hydrolase [Terracoccus luteus]RKT77939.1 glyoxylase-like metal-dependent hydrolase (beta-lactamase superfamily II) [Terracoccus luteus]